MSDPVHTDLEANLRHFAERYAAIEARMVQAQDPLALVRGDGQRRAARLHLDYIRRARADADAKLEAVLALKAARE
jgi:hypothetical protein